MAVRRCLLSLETVGADISLWSYLVGYVGQCYKFVHSGSPAVNCHADQTGQFNERRQFVEGIFRVHCLFIQLVRCVSFYLHHVN